MKFVFTTVGARNLRIRVLVCINSMFIHEVPLRDVKLGVWCAMSATRIIGPIFITRPQIRLDILGEFLKYVFLISDYERQYASVEQVSESSHGVNSYVCCLHSSGVCDTTRNKRFAASSALSEAMRVLLVRHVKG